ncbi:phage tail sheath family protein [Chryseobacterium shandongense]|uniref:Phage tail sheath family protein n=2 Tax=Chryseobacterium TaxID=59732 RepID=A0AAD0YI11_9FLAO|nr:phage tail sheath C-terminal domain-containing protein [Chryseobacterium shandongense]AZA88764.1 phage tail sheath family protein [Chryseobacterium shandongense]AZA97307.1 phage tail sheath family protein [Chryseobacterium shandongense]
MNYKTPGVYVEEHEKFPPSVAQVETAIPAFIGYTAEGQKNKPTRITSMLEYEQLFGKANPETFAVAFEDGVASATQTKVSDFKMYYAMQMYFANGGGPCYIVSVGGYNDQVTVGSSTAVGTLLYGLELLKKEDEPTLIVFSDIQNLVPVDAEVDAADAAADFAEDNQLLASDAKAAANDVSAAVVTAVDGGGDLQAAIAAANAKVATYPVSGSSTISEIIENQAAKAVQKAVQSASNATGAKAAALAAATIYNTLLTTATAAAQESRAYADAIAGVDSADIATVYSVYNSALNQAELMKDRFVIMDVLGDDAIFRERVTASGLKYGAAYHPKLKTVLSYNYKEADVLVTGEFGIASLSELKETNSEFYNQAKKAIESKQVVMAPSSAMAGVYAKVDSTSGVWKSPANLGLNFVEAPTEKISDRQQDALNIDPTSGKSINAIRTFTGKGTLVWGARTLDGNSNEWRYISVRRLFNMVEESVKKATERFVFEANTANTWIRVQTMIENFLNQQWQDGALAGSKPEEAYYVSVGLNKTMSAQDILEGRMNIEIGMAAVRPAEFIVLRFSHKLQEA